MMMDWRDRSRSEVLLEDMWFKEDRKSSRGISDTTKLRARQTVMSGYIQLMLRSICSHIYYYFSDNLLNLQVSDL